MTKEQKEKISELTDLIVRASEEVPDFKSQLDQISEARLELINILLERSHKIKAIEPINMEIIKIDNSRILDRIK